MIKRIIALFVVFNFILSYYQPVYAQAFNINQLPVPGTMVGESAPFAPLALKGLVVNPKKPLEFQFIVDTGDSFPKSMSSPNALSGDPQQEQTPQGLKQQANQLVKYFLAGLTIPEEDLWVNLSPYEKNRMVPEALGQTDLGRDLLAQDYILKQLTASLIYPEKDLGKEFWNRVYAKAQKQFGTTNVPVNTFNKVWILPDQAQVFENNNAAYVTKSTLKVMLDEDYLAQSHNVIPAKAGIHNNNDIDKLGSQIVRAIILPEIEKEVNTGKNFAPLRQIYQALILAKWYKETIQNGLLDAVYTNKNKIAGVNLNDPAVKEQIYNRYLQAYKKGAFNYIKEGPTPEGQVVPKKYFSGGFTAMGMKLDLNGSSAMISADGAMAVLNVDLDPKVPATVTGDRWNAPLRKDKAMFISLGHPNDEVKKILVDAFHNGLIDSSYGVYLSPINRSTNHGKRLERLFDIETQKDINEQFTQFLDLSHQAMEEESTDMIRPKKVLADKWEKFMNAKNIDPMLISAFKQDIIEGTSYPKDPNAKVVIAPFAGITKEQFLTEVHHNFGVFIRIYRENYEQYIKEIAAMVLGIKADAPYGDIEEAYMDRKFFLSDLSDIGNAKFKLEFKKADNAFHILTQQTDGDRAKGGEDKAMTEEAEIKGLVALERFQNFLQIQMEKYDPQRKVYQQLRMVYRDLSGHIKFARSMSNYGYDNMPINFIIRDMEPKVRELLLGFILDNSRVFSLQHRNDNSILFTVHHLVDAAMAGEGKKDTFWKRPQQSLGKISSKISSGISPYILKEHESIPVSLKPSEPKEDKNFINNVSHQRQGLTASKRPPISEDEKKLRLLITKLIDRTLHVPVSDFMRVFRLNGLSEQRVREILKEEKVHFTDKAMSTEMQDGGIDLDQIKVNRTGKTVTVQFDPAQLSTFEQGGFEGFTPVITGFQYIKSPFPLLGINFAQESGAYEKVNS